MSNHPSLEGEFNDNKTSTDEFSAKKIRGWCTDQPAYLIAQFKAEDLQAMAATPTWSHPRVVGPSGARMHLHNPFRCKCMTGCQPEIVLRKVFKQIRSRLLQRRILSMMLERLPSQLPQERSTTGCWQGCSTRPLQERSATRQPHCCSASVISFCTVSHCTHSTTWPFVSQW